MPGGEPRADLHRIERELRASAIQALLKGGDVDVALLGEGLDLPRRRHERRRLSQLIRVSTGVP